MVNLPSFNTCCGYYKIKLKHGTAARRQSQKYRFVGLTRHPAEQDNN